jgi:hypothetical protein
MLPPGLRKLVPAQLPRAVIALAAAWRRAVEQTPGLECVAGAAGIEGEAALQGVFVRLITALMAPSQACVVLAADAVAAAAARCPAAAQAEIMSLLPRPIDAPGARAAPRQPPSEDGEDAWAGEGKTRKGQGGVWVAGELEAIRACVRRADNDVDGMWLRGNGGSSGAAEQGGSQSVDDGPPSTLVCAPSGIVPASVRTEQVLSGAVLDAFRMCFSAARQFEH